MVLKGLGPFLHRYLEPRGALLECIFEMDDEGQVGGRWGGGDAGNDGMAVLRRQEGRGRLTQTSNQAEENPKP
jgi:hypothetical protein